MHRNPDIPVYDILHTAAISAIYWMVVLIMQLLHPDLLHPSTCKYCNLLIRISVLDIAQQ